VLKFVDEKESKYPEADISTDIEEAQAYDREAVNDRIREAVAARNPQIPVENIILNATHTHTGITFSDTPETTPDGKPIYPASKYRQFCAAQCADAICEAWDTRKEGGIAYGYGYAVVSHSRRVVYHDDFSKRSAAGLLAPNGRGVMYGNTADDNFSHYEAGADHFLNALFTFDKENKLTGMVVNVPCPSQISENLTMLSSDYWHDVRQAVAKEFGEDVYVLPQCAAAGDLSPRILHYKQAQARRMALKYDLPYDPKGPMHQYNKVMSERLDIAERIMDGLRDIYGWAMKDIQHDVVVRHVVNKVPLRRRIITEADKVWCEENIETMKAMIPDPAESTPEEFRVAKSRYDSYKNRNLRALQRYEDQKSDPTIGYDIHVTQVGEIAFASNPFELYQDFMHRIQARSPFIQTFIVQLSGGRGVYLPTQRGNANKGYSASMFCNPIGYQGGQELVEYTLGVLNEMKEKDGQ